MDWKQEKFKKLIEYKSGYTWSKEQETDKPEPNAIRVLTVTNIQKELDLSSELYLKDVKESDQVVKAVSKDWCIAVSSNGNRKRIGNAVFVKENTNYLFASFLTAFKPKCDADIIPEFFFRWLTSEPTQESITSVSEGTTGLGNLDLRFLRNMDIEYPRDQNEQIAIAAIFSQVDTAIETVQTSIKAAEKLKKSLTQNLLTGKLKPDGSWRSEDEFYVDEKLGKVPKGWVVKPAGDKSITQINPNYSFEKNKEYDFIPMELIKDGFRGVDHMELKIIDGGGYTRFAKGDILFAKITPCTENGKVALITKMNSEIGFASTEFIIFSPKDSIDNLFYYYLLSSDRVHNLAVSLMEGTTGRQRVPWKVFKNRILVAIPYDLNEQKRISEMLKSIENSNEEKQTKIQTLQRLKKSLMQHVLSGRVRIPQEAIERLGKVKKEVVNA